jgi:methionyl-tRNA formyltransferase
LALLREVVNAFARGQPPVEAPQRDGDATLAPEPDEELLRVDWTMESARLVRRVRAASPWPGVFTWVGEELVTLTEVRSVDAFPRALLPGEAAVSAGFAVVRTGDGAVALLAGRGEDERVLDRRAFAALVTAVRPP